MGVLFWYVRFFFGIWIMLGYVSVCSPVIEYIRVNYLMLWFGFCLLCSLLDILTRNLWLHFLKSSFFIIYIK